MVSLPLVLKKALDKDTLQSRAVISVISTLLEAITGHAVTNKVAGAGIGAGAGLGITLLMYKYFNTDESQSNQLTAIDKIIDKQSIERYPSNTFQSKYMSQ